MRQRRHASPRNQAARTLRLEPLESRTVLSSGVAAAWDSTSPWQNPFSPADLNADGEVSPLDALLAINSLNDGLSGALAGKLAPPALHGLVDGAATSFLDANGDSQLTPGDALQVINALNRSLEDRSDEPQTPSGLPLGEDQPEWIGDDVAALCLEQGLARVYAQLAPAGDVDVFRLIPEQAPLYAAVFPLAGAELNVRILDAAGDEVGTARTLDRPAGAAAVSDGWVTPGETYFLVVSGNAAATDAYALQVINRSGDADSQAESPESGVATQFAVQLPPNVPAGLAVSVHAVALDAWNQPVPNYAGTVRVTSSDSGAKVPSAVTFEHGHAFFEVVWSEAGEQTLTLSGESEPSVTGAATVQVSVSALAAQFAVGLPPAVPIGSPVAVQLLALDARNQPVPGYTGTTSVASSDPRATFPAEVTFRDGHALLTITFATAGEQTLSVAQRNNAALAATVTTKVAAPAGAAQFAVRLPPHVAFGTSVSVQVVALNARNQPVSTYTGTVRVTSSDPLAILPAEVTFRDGLATLNVTFRSAGKQTLTVTDSLDLNVSAIAKTVVVDQPLSPSLSAWLVR